jgi:hypothetical protein
VPFRRTFLNAGLAALAARSVGCTTTPGGPAAPWGTVPGGGEAGLIDAGCRPPSEPSPDFIEQLVDAAASDGATLGDAVSSLRDRLLADPDIQDTNERVVLSRLLDADLDAPVGADAEALFDDGGRCP